jgi:hypothetical protein
MSSTQAKSGRSFEYGVARAFCRLCQLCLIENPAAVRAKIAFESSNESEQKKIVKASDEIAAFLIEQDKNLRGKQGHVRLQSDMQGAEGDVRDVIISLDGCEIGVSAKNRHAAVKHSRLSEKLDFGLVWFGCGCDSTYFRQIEPIFRELKELKKQDVKWKELKNKIGRFYVPVLVAFQEQIVRLCTGLAPQKMVEYLVGKYDFYKIIKENGDVSAYSFNMHETLGWGRHIKLPSRLIEARKKDKSDTTLVLTFDEGWQLSFRIHSAETKVVPSLKFDVQIVGLPNVSQHQIHYDL